MKLFFNLLGIAVAGILGYFTEPNLRYRLTGVMPSAVEMAEKTRVIMKMSDGKPDINLAQLPAHQLPQRVLLKSEVQVTDPASGISLKIEPGNRASLVRVEGGNVRVSPPGAATFEGLVPISATDLIEQVVAAHPSTAASGSITPPEPPPAFDELAMPEPAPVVPAADPSLMNPPVAVEADTAINAEAEVAEVAEVVEEPAATVGLDVVGAMKASISAAEIKEFKADQVQEWTTEPDETIDGETYQIGIASYKAETMFGVRVIQAKALIKNGKVQRWVYNKSGMDMK
jgi:hypothetical protein